MENDCFLLKKPAIAFLTDENYVLPTKVAIFSLLRNWNESEQLILYVLGTESCESLFSEGEFKLPENIHFRYITLLISTNEKGNGRVPFLALYKIKLPELINHQRILYLDCDVIVQGDLSALFHIEMGNFAVGAVPDMTREQTTPRLHSKYGTGVILFQVREYRKQNLKELLWSCINDSECFGKNDKYIFNLCLQNSFFDLETKYNFTPYGRCMGTDGKEAVVIHYWGKKKPWNSGESMSKDLWMSYYRQWKQLV